MSRTHAYIRGPLPRPKALSHTGLLAGLGLLVGAAFANRFLDLAWLQCLKDGLRGQDVHSRGGVERWTHWLNHLTAARSDSIETSSGSTLPEQRDENLGTAPRQTLSPRWSLLQLLTLGNSMLDEAHPVILWLSFVRDADATGLVMRGVVAWCPVVEAESWRRRVRT